MDDAGFPGPVRAISVLESAVAAVPSSGHQLRLAADPDLDLTSEQARHVDEIVREALANAIAHAFPAGRLGTVWVSLQREKGRLRLRVGDDGIGIPDIDLETMAGLAGIQQAAEALGGYARMGSASRTGGEIVVMFPEAG